MNKTDLLSCNTSQKMAICHNTGPALVVAGPGSGKTFVITGRIANLIQFCGIPPHSILTITFTKAAAKEMQKRSIDLIGTKANECAFGTFHSVFYRILQVEGCCKSGAVLSDAIAYRMIADQLLLHKVETDDMKELIGSIRADISRRKMEPSDFHCVSLAPSLFEEIYEEYEKACIRGNYLDFDDLIWNTRKLFLENHDALLRWQKRFLYIQVDEFQDIDSVQYEVIRMLAGDRGNLFAVGDDDQSIYSFRGANSEIMQRFEKDFPGASTYMLNINYRCGAKILEPALELIQENRKRYAKEIFAGSPSDGAFRIITTPNDTREAEFVAESICSVIHATRNKSETVNDEMAQSDKALPEKTIGILARTSAGLRKVAHCLENREISFVCRENIGDFREHFIVKDLLAYLYAAYGIFEREYLLRIMNKPDRGLSRILLTENPHGAKCLQDTARKYGIQSKALDLFLRDLSMIGKMSPLNGIKYILRGCGYERYLKTLSKDRRVPYETYEEILSDFIAEVTMCKGRNELLEMFLYSDSKKNGLEKSNETVSGNITLSTLHRAKGLEYDIVYILDCYQGNIPHKKALTEEAVEEERRLFYVGMTRAKEELYLMYPQNHRNKVSSISAFCLPEWEIENDDENG